MALQHAIMTALRTPISGVGGVLNIQQGGHTTIPTMQKLTNTATTLNGYVKMPFVWDGNVYLPIGSGINAGIGWVKYNHEHMEFEQAFYCQISQRFIPIFDRVGFIYSGDQGWGVGPEERRAQVAANSYTVYDWATTGTDIVMNTSLGQIWAWSYPFTSPPAGIGSVIDNTMERLCELGGKIYSVVINDIGGTLDLYDIRVGAITLVGTPSSHTGLANFDPSEPSGQAFFKFNNKLFFIMRGQTAAYQRFRCFEFDPVAGTSIERNSYLPAGWQGFGTGFQRIFEVRDSITPNEQVFLVYYEYNGIGWECYEFVEGSFLFIDTGTNAVVGGGGVIYDVNAKAAQFKTAVDTVPSSCVESEIEVFDLAANGVVDIDPRYRWGDAESPPYLQCTGKAPNNVVTALSSSPAAAWVPSNLDDDFADGIISEELWKIICLSFEDDDRDIGQGNSGYLNISTIAEGNGAIRFGRAGELTENDLGIGIRSKGSINGPFQMDFTLADPENLTTGSTSPIQFQIIMVKTATNRGYGFMIWKNSTTPYVLGFFMSADTDVVQTAGVVCADGDVLRMDRDGANVWTLTHDPSGTPADLTPLGANYTEEVGIFMGAKSGSTAPWVLSGTPVGSEPGVSNVAVSGAGSVGRYRGGVKHLYDWDHITDLGAGVTGSAELFVDTQRT